MNDIISALDFENIWHDNSDTLVLESINTNSNATASDSLSDLAGPTPDDLADGTWMG